MTTAIVPRNQSALEPQTTVPDMSGARNQAHLIELFLDLGSRAKTTRQV